MPIISEKERRGLMLMPLIIFGGWTCCPGSMSFLGLYFVIEAVINGQTPDFASTVMLLAPGIVAITAISAFAVVRHKFRSSLCANCKRKALLLEAYFVHPDFKRLNRCPWCERDRDQASDESDNNEEISN